MVSDDVNNVLTASNTSLLKIRPNMIPLKELKSLLIKKYK